MRLAVWPVPPARALGEVLIATPAVTEIIEVAPHEARAALDEDRVDLALVPTFDVLRAPDSLALVPGVALAGERCPTVRLVVAGALDAVDTIGFDPRYGPEALLTQLLLKEHYGASPSFVPVNPDAPLAERLGDRDALLVPADTEVEEGAVVLDLGQEWQDLTLRPLVWGLVAARKDAMPEDVPDALVHAVAEAIAPEFYQFTLDGYAHDGLDELVNHLFYHQVLTDLPSLPFVALASDVEAEDAPDGDAPAP